MKILQLVNRWDSGKEVKLVLDDDIHDWIVKNKIVITFIGGKKNTYARIRFAPGKFKELHRYLMPAPKGYITEHKNGNTLDNRKENLRIATPSDNRANSKKQTHRPMTSKYKGVCRKWDKRRQNWTNWKAYIAYKKQRIHLGSFKTEEEAARAYDAKAKELFGEFARLNFQN